jgi:D-alanyl-D-alanine carboxypeptidase
MPVTIRIVKHRKKIMAILIISVVVMSAFAAIYVINTKTESPTTNQVQVNDSESPQPGSTPGPNSDTPKPTPAKPTQKYSLTDPASIWVIVNKQNGIPISYKPDLTVPNVRLRLASSEQQMQIRPDVAKAIEAMFAAAKKDSINLVFGSGYRSGSLQQQFYNSYVARDGKAAADRYSARPGHSEHQTGLSFDLTSPNGKCHLEICWQDTPEGKWVAKNAYTYGFTLRYINGKESITGYQYEPWHFRYVGTELATKLYESNQTLEEYFKLPAASNYD